MHDVFDRLDLNLLRTLNVLLEERSVTRAAKRLGRSQPAVSHALGRLRTELGDALLVREGSGLEPTARALQLQEPVRRTLLELRRVLVQGVDFDPETARRHFRIGCPDALAPLVPGLLEAFSDSPGITLELVLGRGPEMLEQVDIVLDVMPEEAPGVVARVLGSTTPCTILRREHPALQEEWTPEAFVRWPHVLVRTGGAERSLVARALDAVGLERKIGLVVPNLLLAPHVVAQSDLFFTGARELLEPLAEPLGLVTRPPPFPMLSVRAAALWRTRESDDPAHRWFRERVIDAVLGAWT